jgi:hypothetical protein
MYGLQWLSLIPLLTALAAPAQDLRCDLVTRDTTFSGTLGKACLDVESLEGQTLVIPANVTRLDQNGFALCRNSLSIGGSVDLVFIADQNSSMWAKTAYLGPSGDTTYFAGNNGCGSSVTGANVVVPTLEIPTTVPQRTSMAGCTDFSGDPMNARGVAVRQAIDYMASISSVSTAGYIGFGGNVSDAQPPLMMNSAANIGLVKSKVVLRSLGGANYNSPLEQAKTWLNDASLIKTQKQALIFISNGAHQNLIGGYVSKVDASMPPIYTIFMGGKAPSDTINLKELSRLSGGIYYRVPSDRPDSLNSVLRSILDRLLQDFDPSKVSLTNRTIAPTQSSTSIGLSPQGDGTSWAVHMDSALGLAPKVPNSIVLVSEFREAGGVAVQKDTVSFFLSTTGPPLGGTASLQDGLQARCFEKSSLQWVDPAGISPPYFTESDSGRVRLRLKASDSALTLASASVSTMLPVRDAEIAALPRLTIFRTGDSTHYLGPVPMRVKTAAIPGNAILEPFRNDSLIARWAHPRDAQDSARDTIPVRPAQVVASAWFSADSAGPRVSQFPGTPVPDAIWVVVSDNQAASGLTYSITVYSDSQGVDQLTLILTPAGPGLFTARVPFNVLTAKNPADNVLQIAPIGDLLRAVYVDPFYGDRAEAAAGYGIMVQEPAGLAFTDQDGTVLPDSAYWPMERGRVFVRHSDDASTALAAKPISFLVTGLQAARTISLDKETSLLSATSSLTASYTAWSDSFKVAERISPVQGNGVLEGAWRMVVTATVAAHDNLGNPTGQILTRTLIIANADSVPVLTYAEHINTLDPNGPVDIVFTLRDQDFVLGATDTISATAFCPASADSVANIRFVQKSPGTYLADTLFRDGKAANPADRILSCPSGGDVLIRYVDPVFGGVTQWTLHEAAMPTASPATGTAFQSQLAVTLASATAGASIHYTRDGSLPQPDKPLTYLGSFLVNNTATVKAVATKPGFLRSWVMTADYQRQTVTARIQILDSNGFALPGRTVSEAATALRVSLATSQGGLGAASTRIRSARRGDVEFPLLANTRTLGGTLEFWENIAFRVGLPANAGNDTLSSDLPDTLIATWRNPLDTGLVVADTVFVAAAYALSKVYFSDSLGGGRTDSIPTGTGLVYIVVEGAALPASITILATSSNGGNDAETITLTQVRPGVYSAGIPVAEAGKATGDGTVQVSALDQIRARFIHPVFQDTTFGTIGYGEANQMTASVVFLDGAGKALPQDALYSPAIGRIRVRYTDDYSAAIHAKVGRKSLRLLLRAFRGSENLASDSEAVDLDYDPSAGAWLGEVPLRDDTLRSGNDTVETRFRGELTATVTTHDNRGDADGGETTRRLLIGYPDQTAGIRITDAGGGDVTRNTAGIAILLRDQAITLDSGARIQVRLACEASGDREDGVWLTGDGNGNYVLITPFPKDEQTSGTATVNDGRLACRVEDRLTVVYSDPVFGSGTRAEVMWQTATSLRLRFASAADSSTLLSVNDGAATRFLAIAEASTPDRNTIDTLWLVLRTAQGEYDSLPAAETGKATGIFIASIPFAFVSVNPVAGNGTLEGRLDAALAINAVPVFGTIRSGSDSTGAGITLLSQLNVVLRGYVRDGNGDGRAETIALSFSRKLTRVPASLDSLYWNEEASANRRSASVAKLSLSADSLTLRVDLSANPFAKFLTGIPDGAKPVAKLPGDGYFGGIDVLLADSVGPVPFKAVKLPSSLTTYAVGNERRFEPDTIIITVSEAIRTSKSWTGAFRFGKAQNCEDAGAILSSIAIPTSGQPAVTGNGTVFTLLTDNEPGSRIPLKGDCIFLDQSGMATDLGFNRAGMLGVPLEGSDPLLVIRDIRGYPPVAGLDPNSGTYTVANSGGAGDDRNMQVIGSGGSADILWIPPVDFPSAWNQGDAYRPLVDVRLSDPENEAMDAQGLKVLPKGISVVQVVTSGRYIAHVRLYNNHGAFVKSWKQKFGFNGELRNTYRITNQGVRSFLVWDQRDTRGTLAGNGVYVWKVTFELEGGKEEVRYIRTGLVRR